MPQGGFRHASPPMVGDRKELITQGTAGKAGSFKHPNRPPVGHQSNSENQSADKAGPNRSAASVAKSGSSGGKGFRHDRTVLIGRNGGDARGSFGNLYGYLGHFSGESVLNAGHNTSVYMAPGGGVKAARKAGRSMVKAAKVERRAARGVTQAAGQAARKDVRFGKKLVRQATRVGEGGRKAAKAALGTAQAANQARKAAK